MLALGPLLLLLLAGCPFAGPSAAFTASPTEGDAPLTVRFVDQSLEGSAEITSWLWDFGDGAQSVEQNPNHTYTENGFYRVTLRVSNTLGTSTETKDALINVRAIPSADFSAAPQTGNTPLTVQFEDTSDAAPFNVTSWRWTFGDGEVSTEQSPAHVYEQPGEYNVSLTVTSDGGTNTATKQGFIVVAELPEVSFEADMTRGSAPLPVSFTDTSTPGSEPITAWEWTFGDGGTSTEQHPVHEFTTPGIYSITLTTRTDVGEVSGTMNNLVTVIQAPVAAFSASPTSGGVPFVVSFVDESVAGTSEITDWLWDFGDGTSSVQQNPIHTFSESGVYDISLTVTTNAGANTQTKTEFITAQALPAAAFEASVLRGAAPLVVEFTDTSTAGDTPITGRQWNFGDSTVSGGENPVHTYSQPGVYTVSLSVQSSVGANVHTEPDYITVVAAPEADFSASPTSGERPLSVDFTDTSEPGTSPITAWLWEFGDGTTSDEQNPTRVYTDAGKYTVKLTVTTDEGANTETRIDLVEVQEQPTADFTADVTSGSVPLAVQFRDNSTPGTETIAGRTWDFGDGSTSTVEDPVHTYSQPGIYTVTLNLATSSGPVQEQKSAFITVEPSVSFSASPATGLAPAFVTFTDTSDTGALDIVSRTWNFGDGETSGAVEPLHQYTEPGVYDVTLTITTTQGETTFVKTGAVKLRPDPAFTGEPRSGAGGPFPVQFTDQTDPGDLTINGWDWNFGDGTHSEEQSPAHTFAKPGRYNVSLTVLTDIGNSLTTKNGYISIRPKAAFSADVTAGVNTLDVQFTDETDPGNLAITSHKWTFGDNSSSTVANPSHTYSQPGTYTVTLTTDSNEGEDTETKAGYIKVAPLVTFTADSISGTAPLETTFTDNTNPGLLEISARSWDLGEGDPVMEDSPTYTYETPGRYDVSLTVTTTQGETTGTRTGYIEVLPVLSVSTEVTPGTGSASVVFTNETDVGNLTGVTWLWDFDDEAGTTSTEESPTFEFTSPGVFDVTLTLTSEEGVTATDTVATIEVGPVPTFSADVNTGAVPLDVQFTDTTDIGGLTISAWAWDFGDGNTSSAQHPLHMYTAAGSYEVSLTITTALGDVTTASPTTITVIPAPAFTATPLSGAAPLNVTFTDTTDLGGATLTGVLWDFGDGNTSTAAAPTHSYTTPGTYPVSLTVMTNEGMATETKTDYVEVNPIPGFSADATSGGVPFTVNFTDTTALGNVVPTGYMWDFGDGGTSTDQNPNHTYTTAGVYTVSMTITSGQDPVTATQTDLITAAPDVQFTTSASTGTAPLTVTLTDTTAIGNLTVTDWEWDPDDGSGTTTTATNNLSHTYTTPGAYTPTLTLITSGGNFTASLTNPIVVGPVITFSPDVDAGPGVLDVTLTDNTDTGNLIVQSRSWAFGDGGSSTIPAPIATASHQYTNTETTILTRQASLTINTLSGSFTGPTTVPITIHPINFSGDANNQEPNLTVNFTDNTNTGDLSITDWDWVFKDGATASTATNMTSHTYTEAGLYDVELTITTSQGNTATGTIGTDILVRPDVMYFETSAVQGPQPHNVSVQDQTVTGNLTGVSRRWTWGDGSDSVVAGVNTSHTYTNAGCFTATMELLTNEGTFADNSFGIDIKVDQVSTFAPPLSVNNGFAGIMFDLQAKKNINVISYTLTFDNSSVNNNVRYYTRGASSFGFETQPAAWFQRSNTTVTSGNNVPVNTGDLVIPNGNRFGFYLINTSYASTNHGIRYNSGFTGAPYDNAHLIFYPNSGKGNGSANDFDGSTFPSRSYVGTITYTHELTCFAGLEGLAVHENTYTAHVSGDEPEDDGLYPTPEDLVPSAVTPDGGRVALVDADGPRLLRTDQNLDTLWELDLAGFAFDVINDVHALPVGDILLTGSTSLDGPAGSTLLVRLDQDGNFLWERVLASMPASALRTVTGTAHGHVLLLAVDTADDDGQRLPDLYALDEFSNVLWIAELPETPYDHGWSVYERPDGSIEVHGSVVDTEDDRSAWTYRLNPDGSAQTETE